MSLSTTKVIGILVVAALLVTIGYGLLNDDIGETESYDATYNITSTGNNLSAFWYLQPIFTDGEEYDIRIFESSEVIMKDIRKSDGVYTWSENYDVVTSFTLKEEVPVSAVISSLDDFVFERLIYRHGEIEVAKWVGMVEDVEVIVYSSSSEKLEFDNISKITKNSSVGGFSTLTIVAEEGKITQMSSHEQRVIYKQHEESPVIYENYVSDVTKTNNLLDFMVQVDEVEFENGSKVEVEKKTGFMMRYTYETDGMFTQGTIKSTTFGPLSDLKYKDPITEEIELEYVQVSESLSDLIFGNPDFKATASLRGINTYYAIDSDVITGSKVLTNYTLTFDLEEELNIKDILYGNYTTKSIGIIGDSIVGYFELNSYSEERTINVYRGSDAYVATINIPTVGGGDMEITYNANSDGLVYSVTVALNETTISR